MINADYCINKNWSLVFISVYSCFCVHVSCLLAKFCLRSSEGSSTFIALFKNFVRVVWIDKVFGKSWYKLFVLFCLFAFVAIENIRYHFIFFLSIIQFWHGLIINGFVVFQSCMEFYLILLFWIYVLSSFVTVPFC